MVRAITLRNDSCDRPAVVGYTGVRRSGKGVPGSITLNCGCTISSPKWPSRTSPNTRTRLPGASDFW